MQTNWQQTTVVVPCYNEAPRLPKVLTVLREISALAEIIVVDDGSQDETALVAARWLRPQDKLLQIPFNRGKGNALWQGILTARSPWVVFVDADLQGLSPSHLRRLCEPVWRGHAEMSVATLGERFWWLRWIRYLGGVLSGQRCMPRELALSALKCFSGTGYGVEIELTFYARAHQWRITNLLWHGVTHQVKEVKYGWREGVKWQGVALAQMGMAFARVLTHRWFEKK